MNQVNNGGPVGSADSKGMTLKPGKPVSYPCGWCGVDNLKALLAAKIRRTIFPVIEQQQINLMPKDCCSETKATTPSRSKKLKETLANAKVCNVYNVMGRL